MASNIKLATIPRPFASGGQANVLPTSSQGADSPLASWQDGWPEITSKPVTEGGKPPHRKDFNGLGLVLSQYAYAQQTGQYITFSQEVSDAIGGYPKGAVLWALVNNVPSYLVVSVVDNNTNSNLQDASAWKAVTVNPYGFAMLGTLSDQNAAQVRNIQIVDQEPETGVDGTIYAITES